ncbi:helix-turn-helix domain-containing protein [Bacteroidota bacterium]
MQKLLMGLGENIRLARLRRELGVEQVAERAGISRKTLYAIENGKPTTSMGHYLSVLAVLGLERDLSQVAMDDELGRKLQDLRLPVKKRAPKRMK